MRADLHSACVIPTKQHRALTSSCWSRPGCTTGCFPSVKKSTPTADALVNRNAAGHAGRGRGLPANVSQVRDGGLRPVCREAHAAQPFAHRQGERVFLRLADACSKLDGDGRIPALVLNRSDSHGWRVRRPAATRLRLARGRTNERTGPRPKPLARPNLAEEMRTFRRPDRRGSTSRARAAPSWRPWLPSRPST